MPLLIHQYASEILKVRQGDASVTNVLPPVT